MTFSAWTPYSTIPGWQSKYRLVDSNLESELQFYSRTTMVDGFDLNLDQIVPTDFDCLDLEKVGVNVEDQYIDSSIFLGAKLPAHWIRTVSLIIPVVKRDKAA